MQFFTKEEQSLRSTISRHDPTVVSPENTRVQHQTRSWQAEQGELPVTTTRKRRLHSEWMTYLEWEYIYIYIFDLFALDGRLMERQFCTSESTVRCLSFVVSHELCVPFFFLLWWKGNSPASAPTRELCFIKLLYVQNDVVHLLPTYCTVFHICKSAIWFLCTKVAVNTGRNSQQDHIVLQSRLDAPYADCKFVIMLW